MAEKRLTIERFLEVLGTTRDWGWEYCVDSTIHPDGTRQDTRHDIGSAVATVLGVDIQPGEYFKGLEAAGMHESDRTLLCLAKMCPERPYWKQLNGDWNTADWQLLKYRVLDVLGLERRLRPMGET